MQKFRFFTSEREFKSPLKNGLYKLLFALVFIIAGIVVLDTDLQNVGPISGSSSVKGEFFPLVIRFFQETLGSVFSFILFFGIGLIFAFSGFKELINMK